MQILPYEGKHLEAVIHLSLRAWEPVFDSIQKMMNSEVYQAFYPHSWRVSQQKAVEDVCTTEDMNVWVAITDQPEINNTETAIGFIAVKLNLEDSMGEIYMVAVDPDYQGHGTGSSLIKFALDWMKDAGISMAMVETGGDPGHAPARHTYEKAGFEMFPVTRYFKKL